MLRCLLVKNTQFNLLLTVSNFCFCIYIYLYTYNFSFSIFDGLNNNNNKKKILKNTFWLKVIIITNTKNHNSVVAYLSMCLFLGVLTEKYEKTYLIISLNIL